MQIVFMGTATFAVPSLQTLLDSKHCLIGVVSQPDRPAGRGLRLEASPVKKLAADAGLPVYQPETVRDENFIRLIAVLAPDAIIVAAFGQIIPKPILDIPNLGCINVHASLLPKYRGAAPVYHAILNGETVTGVTTIMMDTGLDTGPILLQRETAILSDDDHGTLESRLAHLGASLLLETLDGLERKTITPIPQDHSMATLAPSIKKEDCLIHWDVEAQKIVNRIRACSPKPGAFTFWNSSPLKIWLAAVEESPHGPPHGKVIHVGHQGILVKALHNAVRLIEVQPENRKRMRADEFARGYRVTEGGFFTS